MLSAMKFGLRDFYRLLASGFAADERSCACPGRPNIDAAGRHAANPDTLSAFSGLQIIELSRYFLAAEAGERF
jgi:hypothetical protein